MIVTEFIEKYNAVRDKSSFLKERIVTNYIPYLTKVAECKEIVEKTSYTNTQPKMYLRDTPSKYILFILRLIILYTDIEISLGTENTIQDFDSINQLSYIVHDKNIGVISGLITAISDKEYSEFNNVLKMVEEDLYENERSMSGFLETKFAALLSSKDEIISIAKEIASNNINE